MRFRIKIKVITEEQKVGKNILEWLHEVGETSGNMLEMRGEGE